MSWTRVLLVLALVLAACGDSTEVVRLWSFTVRSREDALADLLEVAERTRSAYDAGQIGAETDETTPGAAGSSTAVIVRGRLTGLPDFTREDGRLRRDGAGQVISEGTRTAPFRVAIPTGGEDYRMVIYAHGMGGDVDDDSFDGIMTQEGAAKLSIQVDDWTEGGLGALMPSFVSALSGGDRVSAGMIETLSAASIVHRVVADHLSETRPTPGAPRLDHLVWAGGSLGGTVGAVYASLVPEVRAAVINSPGAGYSHFLRFSLLYGILQLLLETNYPRLVDIELAIAMAQVTLDPADGAAWVDAVEQPAVFLIQQSIGDPVLANIGSDLVAAATRATHVGAVLNPVSGVTPGAEAVGTSGFTQYWVGSESSLDIHGFAARDTPAGRAAQEQIRAFILSAWDGVGTVIVPPGCVDNTPPGSCDFR